VCRGIHAQSSGTAFETFSLERLFPVGDARRITQMLKKRYFQFYPLSITPVTEKSCLGRQGVNLAHCSSLQAVVGASISGLVGEKVVGKAGASELLMHHVGEEQ